MQSKRLFRIVIAIILVIGVAASLWYASPTRAFEMTYLSLPSGTFGSTHSFSVKVEIFDGELLPIQSINLYIYNSTDPNHRVSCTNLPLNGGGTKSYSSTDTGGGAVNVTAGATNWVASYGYGYAMWQGQGYSFSQAGGYGYGGGIASITYAVTWTSPIDWPPGNYKVDVQLTADSITFTKTSSEFMLYNSGIRGRVAMEARPQGPAWVTSATVQLWAVGVNRTSASPIATYNVTTRNDGSFEIGGIAPGNYDITIKGTHTLRNLFGNVGIVSGVMTNVDFGTLREGDCGGTGGMPDNIVDISDYSAILYSFGTMSGHNRWVVTCDLNQDGVVDIADYSIVLFSFGQMGVAP